MKNFQSQPLYATSRSERSPAKLLLLREPGIRAQMRLVLLIALSVFICEASVMFVISFIPAASIWLHALLDATLLVILLSPVLYFALFRTLVKHITLRRQVEKELKLHRDRLNDLVTERTAELTETNQT